MPFLSGLTTKYFFKKLRNVPGYSFAIQSCMLSGKYPDETGLWMPYYYAPEKSPLLFKLLKKVGTLLPLEQVPLFNYLILRTTRKFFLRKGVHANNIPLRMIDRITLYPYYYLCELPFFENLRKLLMEKNQTMLSYLGPPQKSTSLYSSVFEYLKTSKYEKQVVIAYDDKLDGLGHIFGPNSYQYLSYAQSLDQVLSVLYKKLKMIFGKEFTFVVFSDHGQCKQIRTLDILSELNTKGLKFDDDYFCFIDATIALIWPKNESVEVRLLDVLKQIHLGEVVNEQLKEKYHIKFNDKRYGEIVFVLNPGITFFPNFFSSFRGMKGLHGYLPEKDVQNAFLISNKKPPFQINHVKDMRKLLLKFSSREN